MRAWALDGITARRAEEAIVCPDVAAPVWTTKKKSKALAGIKRKRGGGATSPASEDGSGAEGRGDDSD